MQMYGDLYCLDLLPDFACSAPMPVLGTAVRCLVADTGLEITDWPRVHNQELKQVAAACTAGNSGNSLRLINLFGLVNFWPRKSGIFL